MPNSPDKKFIKLVSSDNYEFYITEQAAFMSKELQLKIAQAPKDRFEFKLNIPKDVLEIVIEYLYYMIQLKQGTSMPLFAIPPGKALEVLNAAVLFKI